MTHTPEPWEYGGNIQTSIWGEQVRETVAFCEIDVEHEKAQENARRIVACVNACRGIPNEVLEAPGYSIKAELDSLDGQIAARIKAEVRRDELLAALKYYADEMKYFPRGIVLECQKKGVRLAEIYSEFGKTARAAIAKIEADK